MGNIDYTRLLRAHWVVRQIWAGKKPKKPPTAEALLRSCMVEEALALTEQEHRNFIERYYFSGRGTRALCRLLGVSEATLYRKKVVALKAFDRAYQSLQ